MRDALLHRASVHGGHFGPNFGIVEATIALHYVFDSPQDKFVFDVSHQSYPHKILTGRKEAYIAQEHYDDVTGYTSPIDCRSYINLCQPCLRPCKRQRCNKRQW